MARRTTRSKRQPPEPKFRLEYAPPGQGNAAALDRLVAYLDKFLRE